jgi:mono/diheme cytochrome c family protein
MSRKLLAAATALLLGGCNWYYDSVPSPDDLMKLVPWFDHMIQSQMVSPYQRSDIPRTTVPGTVPITGGEGDWSAEFGSMNTATADRLVNPTVPEATLVRGDTLYNTFCAVCHGVGGAADGPVGPRVGALSLLTPKAMAFSDGYLYSMVKYGRGVMYPYGDKVYRPEDRWAIVNYVRVLQRNAAAPAPGGNR